MARRALVTTIGITTARRAPGMNALKTGAAICANLAIVLVIARLNGTTPPVGTAAYTLYLGLITGMFLFTLSLTALTRVDEKYGAQFSKHATTLNATWKVSVALVAAVLLAPILRFG